MTTPQLTTTRHLMARYEGFLLDSFGVLLSSAGAIPGARELILALHERALPYLVLTNDASRSPQTKAAWYERLQIPIPPERILTSGALLAPWFQQHGLQGAHCVVLGTPDAHREAQHAGALLVPPGDDRAQVIIAADDDGFDFLPAVEETLSQIFRAIDAGRPPRLLLPNPDLIYPKGEGRYGLTSGSIALLIEEALRLRYPDRPLRFERLGKPHAPIFDAAADRLGTRALVMIGDQLGTDVLGARDANLASALVNTGLARWEHLTDQSPITPTWLLPSLDPDAPTPDPGPLTARRLLISGRVQGVSFRAHTLRAAQRLHVRGHVRNLPDRRVEAHLEGHAHDLDALTAWCHRGPALAHVSSVDISDATPNHPQSFEILH